MQIRLPLEKILQSRVKVQTSLAWRPVSNQRPGYLGRGLESRGHLQRSGPSLPRLARQPLDIQMKIKLFLQFNNLM